MILTENQLDEWVRANSRIAQGKIVELVWRLVVASAPNPDERRFPIGDSIGQHGSDGVLLTSIGYSPYVPEGLSFWEIGTNLDARTKAKSDYRELTETTPEETRANATFLFVTPLSGRRDWQYTWKEEAQLSWLENQRSKHEWHDVQIIDGTKLIDWMHQFPAVELWLAGEMGYPIKDIESVEQHWRVLSSIGEPPPLIPSIFLANREEVVMRLNEIFKGGTVQLQIDTRFPENVADFVSAYIETLEDDEKVEISSRCVFISSSDSWHIISSLLSAHVIVAKFDMHATGTETKLLQLARKGGHAVIYIGTPGGVPHPYRIDLPNPKIHQIQESLRLAGYTEERARMLSQKSVGNLRTLLRLLQNLSLMPEWAQYTTAGDLAIAELLGSWNDQSEPDIAVITEILGNSYGDWISKIRNIAMTPSSPLTQRDGIWRFIDRYEGWYALGPRLFDEYLDRFKIMAITVLSEIDPRFELSAEERFTAILHREVFKYSRALRRGIAESLALLGSHSKALISCSIGKPEDTAVFVIRKILSNADWIQWASLNDLMPLLAEAAPAEFLNVVENALNMSPCPFDKVFAQESSGIIGNNYMTGLLWALETLAWSPDYITRTVVILGELAQRDPGGRWGNRPKNSLTTILLPWFPQTCASIAQRQSAVLTLLREAPDIGWDLLNTLLPSHHQISSGSHKPSWREIIPEDWKSGSTQLEYWQQVDMFIQLVLEQAAKYPDKLEDLIVRMESLPAHAREKLLQYLDSESVASLSELQRLPLWNRLLDFVIRHNKYFESEWALDYEVVNEIRKVADHLMPLTPKYRFQRLFSERETDLFEHKGSYEEQHQELERQRKIAVGEVYKNGGLDSVIELANFVKVSWHVGNAFSSFDDVNWRSLLPHMLESDSKSLTEFTRGFVWGMYKRIGWSWIEGIDVSSWRLVTQVMLLNILPFNRTTWERAERWLGEDIHLYWSKVFVRPYEADEYIEQAVDALVLNGRPNAALQCLQKIMFQKRQSLDMKQAFRVLQGILKSQEDKSSYDVHAIAELIKAMQRSPDTDPKELFYLEWAYLPILDGYLGVRPLTLEQRLVQDPNFFCEVIRTVFRSTLDSYENESDTDSDKGIARNAYHLLREWKVPPGTTSKGHFNGDSLVAWLDVVKSKCKESGNLEVAYSIIGQVLIYSRQDPDGLWIDSTVASVLNEKDVIPMREGFITGLLNSRGVFTWTSGQGERDLTENYRNKANLVEARGYYRFAASLRQLADSYERDANREASRNPFDDMR